ncbi:hypothetical protein VTO42DRAFT_3423 [Malbranchea cinnamomea]
MVAKALRVNQFGWLRSQDACNSWTLIERRSAQRQLLQGAGWGRARRRSPSTRPSQFLPQCSVSRHEPPGLLGPEEELKAWFNRRLPFRAPEDSLTSRGTATGADHGLLRPPGQYHYYDYKITSTPLIFRSFTSMNGVELEAKWNNLEYAIYSSGDLDRRAAPRSEWLHMGLVYALARPADAPYPDDTSERADARLSVRRRTSRLSLVAMAAKRKSLVAAPFLKIRDQVLNLFAL